MFQPSSTQNSHNPHILEISVQKLTVYITIRHGHGNNFYIISFKSSRRKKYNCIINL